MENVHISPIHLLRLSILVLLSVTDLLGKAQARRARVAGWGFRLTKGVSGVGFGNPSERTSDLTPDIPLSSFTQYDSKLYR